MRVLRPSAVAVLAAGLLLAACGDEVAAVSDLCLGDPAPVEDALRSTGGNGRVALPDGTTLAQCVERARSDAELQSLGLTFTNAADHLVVKAQAGDATAARQLGFLAGATQRGAARTNGTHAELARRIGIVAGRLDGLSSDGRAALRAGLAEGERSG